VSGRSCPKTSIIVTPVHATKPVEQQHGDGLGQVVAPTLRAAGELGPGRAVEPAGPLPGAVLVEQPG
jgi:hypothetical protein